MHFPKLSGLVGDHSERPALDRTRLVSPDVDVKSKEGDYVANWRGQMSGGGVLLN